MILYRLYSILYTRLYYTYIRRPLKRSSVWEHPQQRIFVCSQISAHRDLCSELKIQTELRFQISKPNSESRLS